jgi:hypothetical protein
MIRTELCYNAGAHRIRRPKDCDGGCGKDLQTERAYVLRTVRTDAMPAKAFYYYCRGCILEHGERCLGVAST